MTHIPGSWCSISYPLWHNSNWLYYLVVSNYTVFSTLCWWKRYHQWHISLGLLLCSLVSATLSLSVDFGGFSIPVGWSLLLIQNGSKCDPGTLLKCWDIISISCWGKSCESVKLYHNMFDLGPLISTWVFFPFHAKGSHVTLSNCTKFDLRPLISTWSFSIPC